MLVVPSCTQSSIICSHFLFTCLWTGRNREHQGLAAAIVKVWEKSSIVKIAIKRGVPNTSNDRMAEEIKVKHKYLKTITPHYLNALNHMRLLIFADFLLLLILL